MYITLKCLSMVTVGTSASLKMVVSGILAESPRGLGMALAASSTWRSAPPEHVGTVEPQTVPLKTDSAMEWGVGVVRRGMLCCSKKRFSLGHLHRYPRWFINTFHFWWNWSANHR